jgi:hypothetical protein
VSWLVTDLVPQGRATARVAEAFGRELAALHAAGAPEFGAPPPDGPVDAYIGLAPMRNIPGADWPCWYAEHRPERYRGEDDGCRARRPALRDQSPGQAGADRPETADGESDEGAFVLVTHGPH